MFNKYLPDNTIFFFVYRYYVQQKRKHTNNMKKNTTIILIAVAAVIVLWFISARNGFVKAEQAVNKQWGNVETVYQRRADVIPQLVSTVKGAAKFEQETFTKVTEARNQAAGFKLDPNDLTEENVAKFQKLQDNLKNEIQRTISVCVEAYPQLTATEGFKTLQVQIEGTENRISVEREKFNQEVEKYNNKVLRFPGNIVAGMFGFSQKGYFHASEGADVAPVIEF